ncbi:MAG: glycogen synthase [Spirochaetales bacterium]|nr:glycogen synthase [Candidatus Physcosoma equi]
MKVLMVTSETVPFSKSGGLADVVGALSEALVTRGHEVRILMPMFASIKKDHFIKKECFKIPMLGGDEKVEIMETTLNGVIYAGLAHPYFTERKGIYGDTSFTPYADNCPRFMLLSKAVPLYIKASGFTPDIVHCHDWTSGFVPSYLKKFRVKAKTVFTIHNLAYQGVFTPLDAVITSDQIAEEGLVGKEGEKLINMMVAGLKGSDAITTVSPTYAKEILTEEYGCGVEDILRSREKESYGIINGIDYNDWDPEKDKNFECHYSASDLKGKKTLKKSIQEEFHLEAKEDVPLFSIISRLAEQKGFDDLLLSGEPCALERILQKNNCQFAIVGTGDSRYVTKLSSLMADYPNLSVKIAFSNPLAHRLEGGSDFFLMPSKYEPCGLNQLYSLRYGTLPVVHKTGGLADTVIDMEEKNGTGFVFKDLNADEIVRNVERAVEFYGDKRKLNAAIKRAMKVDSTWGRSADEYVKVYENLLK